LYLEVYPDIIFILNFILDYFLLYLLTKVNRKNSNIPRLIAGASVGAIFAVINAVFPWMNGAVRFILMYIAASVFMIWILFGRQKRMEFLKQIILLYLLTCFVGGLMNSIYYYTKFKLSLIYLENVNVFFDVSAAFILIMFLLIVPAVLLIIRLLRWYKYSTSETYEVELVLFGRSILTRGLMDSGNCLYDPIYKKPVMVVDNSLIEKLLPPQLWNEFMKAQRYVEGGSYDISQWDISREQLLRLRFVPYQSIGKTGMLIGINLDKILIHTGKETICTGKVTAAISENCLSSRDDYHVILHRGLM
jgi:stage II sporulation protein GA (sporulation sigma-E factor processing peptidase)